METCEKCHKEMQVGDWPFCPHPANFRHRPFTPVEVDLGKDGKHRISSVQDMRRLERESEKRAANGEGAQISFRAYNNDRSNQDRNSLGENPSQSGFSTRSRRGVPFVTKRGGNGRG